MIEKIIELLKEVFFMFKFMCNLYYSIFLINPFLSLIILIYCTIEIWIALENGELLIERLYKKLTQKKENVK